MNSMGISTDPSMLDVELPRTLIESPSVSTFLPEEEASVCPLLSRTNVSTPLTFSHPLTETFSHPCVDNESNEDTKAESSSTGSSSGIGMEVADTTLFGKHSAYQHLQHNNNGILQDANGAANGSLKLSGDTPSFVSWNWPVIRKFTFFTFISSLFAMFVLVIAMIVTLPTTCNPKTAWYRGSVFYEVFPASFQDSNNDGVGDLRGISNRVDYFASLGVSAVRLNSIFTTTHYPEDYTNVTSLAEIAKVLGTTKELRHLVESFHAQNISLILDLPIGGISGGALKKLSLEEHELNTKRSVDQNGTLAIVSETLVSEAIRKWVECGVDGFFIKGLERYANDETVAENVVAWKNILGPNRVLIVSFEFLNELPVEKRSAVMANVDLVDVYVDVSNGTRHMEERIKSTLTGLLSPSDNKENAWIHWNIGGGERTRTTNPNQHINYTLAANLMQLMLPGTPSIFYGDEISLQAVPVPVHHEHNETVHLHHLLTMKFPKNTLQFTNRETLPWLPLTTAANLEHLELVAEMINLRNRSPSIYKNAICKAETNLPNTLIRRSHDDIFLIERVYPRRNSFVSISNFGPRRVTMDLTSMFYSGRKMIDINDDNEKIYFRNFEIGPFETIVVKLDK